MKCPFVIKVCKECGEIKVAYSGNFTKSKSCKYGLNSKFTKDMVEWYQKQDFYSEDRLNKIYEWMSYAKDKYEKEGK